MTANTKTTWSVWGILFGMAIVLGIGVAFLAFTLTRIATDSGIFI